MMYEIGWPITLFQYKDTQVQLFPLWELGIFLEEKRIGFIDSSNFLLDLLNPILSFAQRGRLTSTSQVTNGEQTLSNKITVRCFYRSFFVEEMSFSVIRLEWYILTGNSIQHTLYFYHCLC